MGEDRTSKRHRQALENLETERKYRTANNKRDAAIFRARAKAASASAQIAHSLSEGREEQWRAERRALRADLLKTKATALERIDTCHFPSYSQQQADWRQALEQINLTLPEAGEKLRDLLARVEAYRDRVSPRPLRAEGPLMKLYGSTVGVPDTDMSFTHGLGERVAKALQKNKEIEERVAQDDRFLQADLDSIYWHLTELIRLHKKWAAA